MIVGEGDVHHGPNNHVPVPHNWPLEYAVHPKDGRLRGVDDRSPEEGTENSAIADRESSSIHVFNSQFIVLGLLPERSNSFLNVSVVHVRNVSKDGNNQALRCGYGNGNIYKVPVNDFLALNYSIDCRLLSQ